MKKLVYYYSHDNIKIHSKYISGKTMRREANGASGVSIYKCNEIDIENILDGKLAGKHIASIILN